MVTWLAEQEALGSPDDATVDDKQNYRARAGQREFYFRRFRPSRPGPSRLHGRHGDLVGLLLQKAEFVRDLTTNPAKRRLVRAIVFLAQTFGVRSNGP